MVPSKATGNSLFEDAKFPPAKEKIPENSFSVKYFILHNPVPKSATFIGSIYNNSSFCLTLHATQVILVFNSSSTVTDSYIHPSIPHVDTDQQITTQAVECKTIIDRSDTDSDSESLYWIREICRIEFPVALISTRNRQVEIHADKSYDNDQATSYSVSPLKISKCCFA